jgi:hypothetical protein
MDLWATKTNPEREDEEAERLVRPLPKVKPPRHDRRRERMDVDYDPDTDEKDPDESKNYKDIGGSIDALLCRWAKTTNVPVRNRDTGDVVPGGVSPETLKKEPGKYEVIKPEEAEAAKGKPKPKKGPKPKREPKEEGKAKKPKKEEGEAVLQIGEETEEERAKAEAEDARELAEQWTNKGRHKRREFQTYLESIPTNDLDETTGEVLVLDSKTKKKVPFDKLPPEAQARLIEDYSAKREAEDVAKNVTEKTRKMQALAAEFIEDEDVDSRVREAIMQLSDPNSEASRKVSELVKQGYDLADIRPDKILPVLKETGVPKGLDSVAVAQGIANSARAYNALSERDKAGIGEPPRRQVTEEEENNVAMLVSRTFPPEISASIIARGLHPDDVRELVGAYRAQKDVPVKNTEAFARRMAGIYETDPSRVKPPKTWSKNGKEVPFENLDPEEQAKAYRQHQMQVVAMSFAAKEQLSEALQMRNWRGKSRVPSAVAEVLSTAMLSSDKSEATTQAMAGHAYQRVLEAGQEIPIGDRAIKALLKKLDPQSKRVAQAIFLANDYHRAKDKFIGHNSISEWEDPRTITRGLKKAAAYFAERARLYGAEDDPLASNVNQRFRYRVLDRLSALSPDKHAVVEARMNKIECAEYKQAHRKWQQAHKKWQARKLQHDHEQAAKQPFGGAAPHLQGKIKPEPFTEPEPIEPVKSPRCESSEGAGPSMDRVLERAGVSKRASWLARRFLISTYARCEAMEHNYDRTAVYHGVEPYAYGLEPYSEWGQAHQRDLGEDDYEKILAAAQDWLKTPVLSQNIKGIVRDQQLRAALDLTIQASKYNRAICPEKYNMLLARLADLPEPGLGQTLQTVQGSTCGVGSHEARELERGRAAEETQGQGPGQAMESGDMTIKLSAEQSKKASEILGRFDRLATDIQQNHESWGMNFDDAKVAVNKLDAAADAFEKAIFGEASLYHRQREVLGAVLQRDPDEPYVDAYQNIHQPHQTDGDEPYMGAYGDDQSSAVETGKQQTGKPLVP